MIMLFSKNNTLSRIIELNNHPHTTSRTPNKSFSFSKVGFGSPSVIMSATMSNRRLVSSVGRAPVY